MTYAEILAAVLSLGVFFPAFASAVPSLVAAWVSAEKAHVCAGNVEFVARGFRAACAGGILDEWRFAVSVVDGLEIDSIDEVSSADGWRILVLRARLDGLGFEVFAEGGSL